jgi:WD40 repeat protein
VAFNHEDTRFLVGTEDGTLQVWDWEQKRLIQTIAAHLTAVERIDACGDKILTCGQDGTVRLWNLEQRPAPRRQIDAGGAVRSLHWTPDSSVLQGVIFTGNHPSWPSAYPQWQASTLARLAEVLPAAGSNLLGSWSPDGTRLATVDGEGALIIRTAAGKVLGRAATGHRTWDVTWSPSGDCCGVFDQAAGSTLMYDTASFALRATIPACPVLSVPYENTFACAWNPDGTQLLLSSKLVNYHPRTGALLGRWPAYDTVWDTNAGQILAWSWQPGATRVALGTVKGIIEIRESADGRLVQSRRVHGGLVRCVDWHPTEPLLASAGRDGRVCILDAGTLEELIVLRDHGTEVRAVAWSPDGRTLASGDVDGRIFLWEAGP